MIVNAPEHVTAMAELGARAFAGAVATWRERMRAHRDSHYVQLAVNEGAGAGASLPHTHAQLYALPFVPLAVARERERFGAYRERTGGSGLLSDVLVAEVRKQGSPGGDRRRGGADLPLGVALAVRAAGRAAGRGGPFEDGPGRRGDAPHGAAGAGGDVRRPAGAEHVDPHRAARGRALPLAHRHRPACSIRASFELATGVDINIYPPERAASDLRAALGE